ncbi:hypothetical protein EJB05_44744, partial [Eragrostis curvula]
MPSPPSASSNDGCTLTISHTSGALPIFSNGCHQGWLPTSVIGGFGNPVPHAREDYSSGSGSAQLLVISLGLQDQSRRAGYYSLTHYMAGALVLQIHCLQAVHHVPPPHYPTLALQPDHDLHQNVLLSLLPQEKPTICSSLPEKECTKKP